jgi:hypothetical protein
MAYMHHIDNLYKDPTVLLFKECWALEKLDGTGSKLVFKDNQLQFHSGGSKHETFVALFDPTKLAAKLLELGMENKEVTLYGEAYGGKIQKMSETYGKQLKFAGYDVNINGLWLSVPDAENIFKALELEFVYYSKISTNMEEVDKARDADSQQAIRNGCGSGKIMEGVILRPLIEVRLNNGARIIAKHKRAEFMETAHPREVNVGDLEILKKAEDIANEWVVPNRLNHVLANIPDHCIEKMGEIIKAMQEDVLREAKGEIVVDKLVIKAIAQKTVKIYKEHLNNKLRE